MSAVEEFGALAAALWFLGVFMAMLVLFAAGLRLPIPPAGMRRGLARVAIVIAARTATGPRRNST